MGQTSSKRRLITCLGAGLLLGIVCFALRWNLPPESIGQKTLNWLDSPVTHAVDLGARLFANGNTDQFIPQGVLLWFAYWIMVGCVLGFALYKFTGRFSLRFLMLAITLLAVFLAIITLTTASN